MRAAGEIEQVVAISSGPAGRRREAPGTPERKEKQVSEPRPAVSYWGARVESNLLQGPGFHTVWGGKSDYLKSIPLNLLHYLRLFSPQKRDITCEHGKSHCPGFGSLGPPAMTATQSALHRRVMQCPVEGEPDRR